MIIIDAVGNEHPQYVGYNVFGNFIILDVHTHTHTHTHTHIYIYIYIYVLPVMTVSVTTFAILWLILFTVSPDDEPRAEACRI
jgi:hypothetical protein